MIPKPSEVIHSVADRYQAARAAKEIPFWIVFWISLYTPFEEFVIKWLGPLAGIARFVPELVLYGLMAQVLTSRFFKRNLKPTPIDLLLVLFFLSTLISIALNDSSLKASFLNLRSLWRYLSVFYIVVNIDISVSRLSLIITSLRTAGLVQAAIASVQFFLPNSLLRLFAPKGVQIAGYSRVSHAEAGTTKVGAVFGLFAAPAVLSAFLLVILIISMTYFFTTPGALMSRLPELSGIGTIFFGLFATKKRAAWILAVLVPIVVLIFYRKSKGLVKTVWVYTAVALSVVLLTTLLGTSFDTSFEGTQAREESIDVGSYVLQLFDPNYWEDSSETSRGWVVGTTIHTLTKSGSWFGFGPDLYQMRQLMADVLVDGSDRAKIIAMGPLEDTYWLIMLAYFGVVGMGIYAVIIWRLFQSGRWLIKFSPDPEYRRLGVIFCTLVIFTILYNFIERILELRGFSLYFWLFAGLVVNAYNAHQRQRIESSPVDD